MPDDSHLLPPLDATSVNLVSVTGLCNAALPVTMTITADDKPTVTVSSPHLSGPTGVPPSYQYSCRRPPSGTTSFEVSWTSNGQTHTLHTTVEAAGPAIIWPKTEGPKLRIS
jgi:hypothetical protein